MIYRVDFMRHGEWDHLEFQTSADAHHFEWWGLESGVFIRSTIHSLPVNEGGEA